MIKQRTTIRPFELVLGVIILYTVMPIVSRFFSDFLTTYAYMILLLGAVVFTMTIRSESILMLIPFILWMLLDLLTQNQPIIEWGYGSMLMLAPILFGVLLMKDSGPKVVRFLAVALAISVLVTIVTTIIGSIVYPDAPRYLATADSDSSLLRIYNYLNLGGYDFIYTCVLLYPLVVFAFKQKRLRLIWAIFAAFLVLVMILNSGYTTAFLLWMATTAMFFLPRNLNKRGVLFLLIVTILAIVLFFTLFSAGIKSLAKLIDNEDIAYRLEALSGGSEGIRASEDDRLTLYEMSIESFFKSPLIGGILKGSVKAGGHSFILDFAAQYGLIGIVLLIVMYRVIFVRFYKPFERVQGYGYILWMFLQTLILSTVNTGMWINILAWFIPLSVTAILQKGAIKPYESLVGRKLNA